MTPRRRSRHGIVGSEAGRPRPMAYMRRGRTRRSRGLRFSRAETLLRLGVLLSLLLLAVLAARGAFAG